MSVRCRCRATGVGLEKLREGDQNRQALRGEVVIGPRDPPPLRILCPVQIVDIFQTLSSQTTLLII
jgi:hypothetical protein